jgi:GDP-L-fucose synthase
MNKILVTGGTGMVGKALENILGNKGVYVGRNLCNFKNLEKTIELLKDTKPSAVIHLAARVGGVTENKDHMAEFYYDNMMINLNVLHGSHIAKVPKVVSLLSTCIFPDAVKYPLTEEKIHNGEPHHTNFGYAYAKRMLDVQSRSYRRQYGSQFITAVPNNLYGNNDNFHLTQSHVIPAMIRKIYEAKINHQKTVKLWGDGTPLREFTHVSDIARILLFLVESYEEENPINIGNTEETSILTLAETIAMLLEYEGELVWDTSFPNGQHKKPSSNNKLKLLGWNTEDYVPLKKGLQETCSWFVENYPKVRGV